MPAAEIASSTASSAGRLLWMSVRIATCTRGSLRGSRRVLGRRGRAIIVPEMRAWKLGATAVAAVIVAEAGVWLLRPREGTVEGPPVPARAYFSPEQIKEGKDFVGGQRLLMF